MKRISKILIVLTLFLISSSLFCGCELFLEGTTHTISGYVFFDGHPLENVKITDKITVYTTTDQNGYFCFSTKKTTLQLYPQKSGFVFDGQSIVCDQDTTIDFVGQKATKLNGTLVLKQILVQPVSIVSFSDNNFLYNQNQLKIRQLKFNINNQTFLNSSTVFATTKQQTNLWTEDFDFEYQVVDGYVNIKISYELSTFYTSNERENVAIENQHILRTEKVVDTGCLYDGKFELAASGINSIHNGFSYNISFVFDFVQGE